MSHRTSAEAVHKLAVGFTLLFLPFPSSAQSSPASGSTPFVLDGNRMYAELSFVRPDGSFHKTFAFVDMGSPSTILTESLFKGLQLDQKKPLIFRVGDFSVQIPAGDVTSEHREPYSLGSGRTVEAMLPAGVLQKYQIVIDYQNRTLTFAQPGTLRPKGIPTAFHINNKTGLIAVDASLDGKPYRITIDNGSAYTWFRQSTVKGWLATHPEWERGVGAVGASNMMMAGGAIEALGILARIPEITIGSLVLKEVGVLGPGPGEGFLKNLFDWYSTKNPLPVIGWIGGNVLKAFRLTIDYPNRTVYWLQQTDPDSRDLDQVGLTLKAQGADFIVAAVATKNGKPAVEHVQPGDKLIRVDDLETKHATWGAVYSAMHGKHGDTRVLVLDRGEHQLTVKTIVTAF